MIKLFLAKIKRLARKIVELLITIIILIIYFVFIAPFGILVRVFKDYLAINSEPGWRCHEKITNISDFLRRQ
ncbi:MAG: hypothetical protein K9L71_04355 [Candidatus Omnitrophica bacterium]|nr:hypothetical protein [Candidatus Omnitrophota bacterium]